MNVKYILSIIQRADRKACHIIIIYIFKSNQFQAKCPFLLGTDEKSMVFNGLSVVYTIIINKRYPANKYGTNSGCLSIFIIFNIG
jgi:hypothetical protein